VSHFNVSSALGGQTSSLYMDLLCTLG